MKTIMLSALLAVGALVASASDAPNRAKPITNPDGTQATTLLVCGDTYVYAVQPDQIPNGEHMNNGIIWTFDARDVCFQMGLMQSNMDHVDDCKPIDNNERILITSSAHWAMIVDYATKKLEFWTKKCTNAHSAEMLPGNKIVVACAEGTDQLQLYDRTRNDELLHTVSLPAAHGCVWDDQRQRLYAIGKKKLGIYRLEGAETDTPQLVEEAAITTPKTGTHDLTRVDDHTLCVSGRNSYFFDLDTHTFTELTQFNGRTAIKSVNYNIKTNEAWYTDASNDEEDIYSWATQVVRHTSDPMGTTDDYTFTAPYYNLYKVRPLYWGGEEAAGVEAVSTDNTDATLPAEYFNLQGIPVVNPEAGNVYIRRQGSTTDKVLL